MGAYRCSLKDTPLVLLKTAEIPRFKLAKDVVLLVHIQRVTICTAFLPFCISLMCNSNTSSKYHSPHNVLPCYVVKVTLLDDILKVTHL